MSSATKLPERKLAPEYGEQLLADLGVKTTLQSPADHPAVAWKRSGLLDLSGHIDGPALMVPIPLASAADGVIAALKSRCDDPTRLPASGSQLLGERARLMGLQRNGRASPGGHCRLLDAKDGRLALNLAREDDWDLLAAWLEQPASKWQDIERITRSRTAEKLVRRGVELGMAIALDHVPEPCPWFKETLFSPNSDRWKNPLVVDLSSLWAGPLAGHLLHVAGANVVKVESLTRPDGARKGNTTFYALLNAGKQCAAFDFASEDGRSDLKKLIAAADIVIEASRSRALQQLGIDAEKLLREKPGKVWLRLAAYGEDQNRIGFGDDVGVASGLCTIMEKAWGEAVLVGDAIADPLSGLFGALAALTKWQTGEGCLIHLSMRDVVRYAMQIAADQANWSGVAAEWQAVADADHRALYPMRKPSGKVEDMGISTSKIMAGLC